MIAELSAPDVVLSTQRVAQQVQSLIGALPTRRGPLLTDHSPLLQHVRTCSNGPEPSLLPRSDQHRLVVVLELPHILYVWLVF
jgi:hypothetical protein